MQNIPSFSLSWNDYIILGNVHFFAIYPQQPSGKWDVFYTDINKICSIINNNIFDAVTSYSIKYTYFIALDNIVIISTLASLQNPLSKPQDGIMIDITTINNLNPFVNFDLFQKDHVSRLVNLHNANIKIASNFFPVNL
ncbi:MAG: hypothetical protein LBT38_02675 [Deltaproteobacteria bacterium]|jgi:hypothetical protein|nr:hypothetical protein [Deltaproteobacteria bacterium]